MITEKDRRIYYQDIVYQVCNALDRISGNKPGHGIVCGTADEPSREVQGAMEALVRRFCPEKDKRIVYGAQCVWWGSISEVATRGPMKLPCCPICKGMLLEMDSEDDWWAGVDRQEAINPGYREFIQWLRGKCFKTHVKARDVFNAKREFFRKDDQ